MLTDKTGNTGATMGRAVTHRDVLAGTQQAAGHTSTSGPRVQLRRYHPDGAMVLCGQVVELREDGTEWFKVDTSAGPFWALGKNLRMCSGDGRCTCELHPGEPACSAGKPGSTPQIPVKIIRTTAGAGHV